MTADPRVITLLIQSNELSYVTMELYSFGGLSTTYHHPVCIKNIPILVRIHSTPTARFYHQTKIENDAKAIKGISNINGTMITVASLSMVGVIGVNRRGISGRQWHFGIYGCLRLRV